MPGPSLWSGRSCLVTVVDRGSLAHALCTDHPGLADNVLCLLPGMHEFAGPLRRGAFLAEILARMMLELQRIAGAASQSRCALTVHGRQQQVRIITGGQAEGIAVHAFDMAASILVSLCNGKKLSSGARMTALRHAVARLRRMYVLGTQVGHSFPDTTSLPGMALRVPPPAAPQWQGDAAMTPG